MDQSYIFFVACKYSIEMSLNGDDVGVKMNERTEGVSSIRNWKNFYYMFNVILSIIIVGMEERK